MPNHLVLNVLGRDRPGLLDELSQVILEAGCKIGESRMAVLGSEFAGVMLISGNWSAVAKVESAVSRMETSLNVSIQVRRTEERTSTTNLVPYGIEIAAIDHPGVVHDVAGFFAKRAINIEDVYTSTYRAPHTGATMFSLHMTVGVPSDTSIATLRGDFMDFCDDLNLDAMFAPVK